VSVYTREEELLLGHWLLLQPDEAACDRYGCDRSAFVLTPHAALCLGCAVEFGIGGDVYAIPPDQLVGGDEWREARRADYLERINRLPPIDRDERRDALLDRLAAAEVDRLLRSLP
jgi:hypothetical protein